MLDTAGGSTSAPAGDAAIPVSPAPHIVHLACPCPGHPHEYDVVTLRKAATNKMGMAVNAVMQYHIGDYLAIESELGSVWLRYGIEAWTFVDRTPDPKGGFRSIPVYLGDPVDMETVDRWLPWHQGGFEVIKAADELYRKDTFDPFQRRPSTRSPDGAEAPSTSASTDSGLTPPTPLRRSSRGSSGGKRSGR
jgi:hypothetical protein